MSIYKISLTDQLAFRTGKKYNLKEGCIVDNIYYQSTKNNNSDHPLMGKSWNQTVLTEELILSSTTLEPSSSSLHNSTSTRNPL